MPRVIAVLVFVAAAALALGSYHLFHAHTSEAELRTPTNVVAGGDEFTSSQGLEGHGQIEATFKSDYSNIRIRKRNSVRTLSFVRDSGEEVVESTVDINTPYDLIVPYTRFMFLS